MQDVIGDDEFPHDAVWAGQDAFAARVEEYARRARLGFDGRHVIELGLVGLVAKDPGPVDGLQPLRFVDVHLDSDIGHDLESG